MARLTDPRILACFEAVLSNWNYTGYVEWRDEPKRWLLRNMPALSEKKLAQLMWDHLQSGGEIDQVVERRPEWTIYDYHYDFRLEIAGHCIYVETVLDDHRPDDPNIQVVSIHDV